MRRLIPARAGNIVSPGPRGGRRQAHPRSRGEHPLLPRWRRTRPGSSPLARGTSDEVADAVASRRLIPARAGNIALEGALQPGPTAHPRSRGEHKLEQVI